MLHFRGSSQLYIILLVGKGALLEKWAQEIYRMILVNPNNQFFLTVQWTNRTECFPLGSGRPQKVVFTITDAMQWILQL